MRGRMSDSSVVQGRGAMATVDATRPVGDRYVPPSADRPADAYEAAMADAHRITDPHISQHYADATAHVRIDADDPQERR